MRQKDDPLFAKALNGLSSEMHMHIRVDDMQLFSSRLFSEYKLELPEEAIRLYGTNAEVDHYTLISRV